MTEHAQLKFTHDTRAPNTNTIRMPMVKNSWKHVPNRPRIDVSAYSDTYMGATTHEPPTEIPANWLMFLSSLIQLHHDILISWICYRSKIWPHRVWVHFWPSPSTPNSRCMGCRAAARLSSGRISLPPCRPEWIRPAHRWAKMKRSMYLRVDNKRWLDK